MKLRTSYRAPREVPLNPFRTKAIRIMKMIPKGRVASYSQVAALAGKPGGAREIAWLLHHIGHKQVPWQRVVGAAGKIMFPKRRKEYREQITLLRKEGVDVSDRGQIAMEIYQWSKQVRRKKSGPQMFSA